MAKKVTAIKEQEIKNKPSPPEVKGPKKWYHFSQEEKVSYAVLGVLILLVLFIRTKFNMIGFERDEGTYGYYGKLLLEGNVPYKDFYEQKFPGIFYFFAMMVGLFGDTVKGLHNGFMILNIITFVLLFFASKKLFSPTAAAITATTYAIVSLTPNLSGYTVQAEHGVAFFISLGIFIYAFNREKKDWKLYLLMGLAMGTAFMTKTSGMFLVLWGGIVTITDYIFENKKFVLKEVLIRALLYSAGVFFMIGVFFALIALKGSFENMIYWAYEVPKRYVNRIKWEEGKKYLDFMLTSITEKYKFFWLHAFFALAILLFKNISWQLKAMAVTLIFFSCMTVVPGFYFYGHYWIQIIPGLSIMAGLTYFALNKTLKERFGMNTTKLPYIYLGLFGIITLLHLNKEKDYYFNPNYDRILRSVYGSNPFPETMNIANYLNARMKPEDKMVAIGSEPEIYFYTKKRCPSRHAYFAALVEDNDSSRYFQKEFIRDVEKAAPKYFIFYNHQISLFVQPNSDQGVFEWYNKYVNNYKLIGLVDMTGAINSTYVWGDEVNTYKPQSQSIIYVFERKPGV